MSANPGATLGQYAGLPGNKIWTANKASGIAIVRGDLLKIDTSTSPDSVAPTAAAANQFGPFCMATKDAGIGTTEVEVVADDVCYLRADGTIEVGSKVQAATATAAQAIAFAQSTVSASPTQTEVQNVRDDRLRQVGIMRGKPQDWSTGAPTAVADNDLAAVYIPAGGF